jgi:CPA2 family monovalent cation:H+ antiporter-2
MMTRGVFTERELVVLLAILSALGAIWGAHTLGLSPALGAFLAGMLLGESPFASQIRADIGSVRILFLTLFFTSIGMLLDPRWMLSHIHLVLLSTVVIFFLKTATAAGGALFAGISRTQAVATGITLAQIGEFSLVAASVAAQNRIIGEETLALVVGVTVLSLFLTPYMVVYAEPLAKWMETRLAGKKSITAFESLSENSGKPCGIAIIGFGPAGRRVAEALLKKNQHPEVIELSPASAQKAQDMGLRVHQGDATSLEFLEHCGMQRFQIVVVAVPDPATARTLIHHVRTLTTGTILVVRARYDISCQSLKETGADVLVNEESLVGEKLAESLLNLMEKDGMWEMACGISGSNTGEQSPRQD